jgi:glycerophosphoryl diester phosphodiesterase/beta-lactamase superfamily II metal-dependent hydrolase
MKHLTIGLLFGAILNITYAQQVGQALPPWQEGMLDLHHINTGMGDAAFYIFPDGTTMLVDAGEMPPNAPRAGTPRNTVLHPNNSKTAPEWIVQYIRRFMPAFRTEAKLDYAMITHFHDDHWGSIYPGAKKSTQGDYVLTGITAVGDAIPIGLLLDRGYPDYKYPLDYLGQEAQQIQAFDLRYQLWFDDFNNYLTFIKTQEERKGMQAAKLQVGSRSQISLQYKPQQFPEFHVRNVKSNGTIWSGVGEETFEYLPDPESLPLKQRPGENPCSNAIRIKYGAFDYFTGGDMSGVADLERPWWIDVETPVAQAIGPTDVTTLNHHGNQDAMNEHFIRALQARVYIHQNWSSDHPGHQVLRRMTSEALYPGPRDLFATNMLEANKIVIGPSLERAYQSTEGHILVRVQPGGATYQVIILDDDSEEYLVKAVFGPYEAKDVPYSPAHQHKLIAHRGGIVEGKYAENSEKAIQAAIDAGYYMLELDLRETKDGTIIIQHDPDFKKFYGVEKQVAELNWDEIKTLRAVPGNTPVLRLEEALALCQDKIQIMVDTKGEEHPDAFYERIEQLLSDHGLLQRALIIGSQANRAFFKGKAKVGINLENLKQAIKEREDVANLYFLFLHGNELTPEIVAYAEKYGVLVVPSVNLFHYTDIDPMEGAKRDIDMLKAEGVQYFQIDSEFDRWLLPGKEE